MNASIVALVPELPRKSNCGPRTDRERNTRIVAMFRAGADQSEIAAAFGLCAGAVGNVLRMYGVSRHEGGKSLKARRRSEAAAVAKRDLFREQNGILPEDFPSLETFKLAKKKFFRQRQAAACRGVSWEISLGDWWRTWEASGCWDQRGRGVGKYCMARHGDSGPYKVGNVSIQLATDNSRDGIKIAHASMRDRGYFGGVPAGSGRGWTYIARATSRPYQVMARRRYIGCFATQEEAEAAYAAACRQGESLHGDVNPPFFCAEERVMTAHKSCPEMRDAA